MTFLSLAGLQNDRNVTDYREISSARTGWGVVSRGRRGCAGRPRGPVRRRRGRARTRPGSPRPRPARRRSPRPSTPARRAGGEARRSPTGSWRLRAWKLSAALRAVRSSFSVVRTVPSASVSAASASSRRRAPSSPGTTCSSGGAGVAALVGEASKPSASGSATAAATSTTSTPVVLSDRTSNPLRTARAASWSTSPAVSVASTSSETDWR